MILGLTDKVVVVTGASRGIGRSIAHAFAMEEARLSICGRDPNMLKAITDELKPYKRGVFAKPTDVTDSQQVQEFMSETIDHFGRIDVVVNNVGGSRGHH